MPRDARLREVLRSRLEDLVLVLLLPLFFALTGLRTDFRLIGGSHDLAALGLVLAVMHFVTKAIEEKLAALSAPEARPAKPSRRKHR